VSYFARHDAADIAWHARILRRHVRTTDARGARTRCRPVGEGLQVLVYSPDRPDLFARICGYFDSASFNILDAAHRTPRARATRCDTFQVVGCQRPDADSPAGTAT
jgi:[protein-PII] uridylyltransferase